MAQILAKKKGMHLIGVWMYFTLTKQNAHLRRCSRDTLGGNLLFPSKSHASTMQSLDKKSIFWPIFAVYLLLFSILLSFPLIAQAEPSKPASSDNMVYKTTWTFADPASFNVSDCEIEGGKVNLKSNELIWNQTTKSDFNKGTQDNVIATQKTHTEIIFEDGFEYAGEGNWTHGNLSGINDQWQHGIASNIPAFIGVHLGNYAWGTNLFSRYADAGQPSDYYLKSPEIDLQDSKKTEMSFWHYYTFENETVTNDGGIIEVSIDNGSNWEQVWPKAGYGSKIDDPVNPLYPTDCFGGNSTAWVEARFDLSKYDGERYFAFRFRFATNGLLSDYGWYVDDVQITSTTQSDGEIVLGPRNLQIGNDPTILTQRPANLTIIDANNPANVNGILTSWSVHVANIMSPSAKGQMKIFREVGSNFVFVDETFMEQISIGENLFECYIEVKSGDYIGWYGEDVHMWGKSPGRAYSLSGNISQNTPNSSWTPVTYTYSLRATGISINPTGSLTSQIFDAGSNAQWDWIEWGEEVFPPETDIVMQTRTGNPFGVGDISWSQWTDPITDSSGSIIINPTGRYFQFKATLTTSVQPKTPTLFNVSVEYRKYASSGNVETFDFAPGIVVSWLSFSKTEILAQQSIGYYYSLDSGNSWTGIPGDGDLSDASVLGGKIRFRMDLATQDTTLSPQINDISLTYSNATPQMALFLDTGAQSVHPGDTVSIRIFYHNRGIGNATNVDIVLLLDDNLIYKTDNVPVSPSIEAGGKAIRWQLSDMQFPGGNRTHTVELSVKEMDQETRLTCSAQLNYSDIGGNIYPEANSNTLAIMVTPNLNLWLLFSLIAAAVIMGAVTVFFIAKKRKRDEETKEISLEEVERGIGYLIMEDNPTKSYNLFSRLIDAGNSGLCITRTFPGRVKSNYSFEGVSILWLSRAKDQDSILPTNLGAVLRSIKDFMEGKENPVVLLDGLEYLIVHNEFPRVLKLVHILNEMAAINSAVLIFPLNPLTLDEGKVALLKRDLRMLT